MCKKLLLSLSLLLFSGAWLQAQPQFMVNGIVPAFDQRTNTFLLSVSEQDLAEGFSAQLSVADVPAARRSLQVDGQAVQGQYTFPAMTEGRSFDLEIATTEGSADYHLQFTSLPVVTIQTQDIGNEYTQTTLLWQENGTQRDPMLVNVKRRGASTNAEGKHKRNYKLSFVDASGDKENHSFGSLRNDNSWILDAGQVDLFRLRNYVMAQLWQDFAQRPYYSDRETKALSATRGMLVEVFRGNEYQGVYHLCEPIDRKQMKLKKFDADGTIHGGLWRATAFGDATFFGVPAEYDNTKAQNDVWEVKYPKLEDLCPTDYSTLRNAILFVASSTDEEFKAQVADYFDLPVMIDYYLFAQVGNLYDISGKNVFWAVYDKQTDKKLTPAMWDLDGAMGQNYTDDPLHPDYVAYNTEPLCINNIFNRLVTLNPDHFWEQILARYAELRQTYFSVSSLQSRYQKVFEQLRRSGAMLREQNRWSHDTDIAGLPLDFAAELDYITEWIALRMDYLDPYFTVSAIEDLPAAPVPSQPRTFDLRGLHRPGGQGFRIENGKKILPVGR